MAEQRTGSYENQYKFTGQEFDPEIEERDSPTPLISITNWRQTGFYYYGARYYHPGISVFLAFDPAFEITWDAYGYVYNNPVRYVDPSGMFAVESDEWYWNKETGEYAYIYGSGEIDGWEHIGTSVSYFDEKSNRFVNGNTQFASDGTELGTTIDYYHSDGTHQGQDFIVGTSLTVQGRKAGMLRQGYIYAMDNVVSPISESATTLGTVLIGGFQGAGTGLYYSLQGMENWEVQRKLRNTKPWLTIGGHGFENGKHKFHDMSQMSSTDIANYYLGNALETSKWGVPTIKIFRNSPQMNEVTTGALLNSSDARSYKLIQD